MPAKTTEWPAGWRITYAPHLLDKMFRVWAKSGHMPLGSLDIEATAYQNLDIEADLWQWYLAVDYAAYLKKSKT